MRGTLACLAVFALVAGCASTKVESSGLAERTALCPPEHQLSALVLWGPVWRPDQKDVPLREEAARHGLEDFLGASDCFSRFELRRLPGGRLSVVPSDEELLSLAVAASPRPDRVLVVTVRELGPVVKLLGSAAVVEGGTEVVLQLDAIDATTGTALMHSRSHWQNGGAFVIKGVASLRQDMTAALRSALLPPRQPP